MGSYKVLYDYPNYASLPAVGDVSRLYITNDTNTLYRWVDGAYHFFTTTSVPWGNIDGVLTNQTDLMAVLNGKQPLITAGTTVQYYRGDKTFQTLNTTAVPEGTNLYWTDARFNTGFSAKTTSNLTEGTNLYYTDARFDARLATKSTTNLAEGTNLYYTQGRFDSAFGAKSTSNLAEGTNLYYTDARFDTRLALKTTDNLTEGATRLYYSSGRFNADFNSKTTDNLTEGSTNLFWTPARSRNALTLLTVGTGGLATYNSTTGQLNIPQYQTLLTNPLVGAGAQYYVPRYSDTTTLTPGLIYDNGVYVGINRTNPFYTLDINGTLNVEGTSILRALAGSGDRVVYVNSSGQITPATIGTGLSLASGVLTATGTGSGSIGGTGTSGYIPKFSGTSSIANSNLQDSGTLITLNSNSYITGSLGIGDTNLTGFSIRISKNITGGTTTWGIHQQGVVQSDVTGTVNGFSSAINTQATSFTLTNYNHFRAVQGTLGVGSAVTNQYGFVADSSLVGAANNFGFFGNISSASGRWNLYMAGSANNYMAGALGIGATSLTNFSLNISKNISGSAYSSGVFQGGSVQSDVTGIAYGFNNYSQTQAASFTLGNYYHFYAQQGTIGSGSSITSQVGYFAESSLTGATNNYGFYGAIPSGTNRWNLYMNGTANNYLAGNTLIGTTTDSGYKLDVNGTARVSGAIRTDAGNNVLALNLQGSSSSIQATPSSLNSKIDIISQSILATLSVTANSYYDFRSNTAGATLRLGTLSGSGGGIEYYASFNNPSGFHKWFYNNTELMRLSSTSLLIGTTTDAGYKLDVNGTTRLQGDTTISSGGLGIGNAPSTTYSLNLAKTITGGGTAGSILNQGVIQSGVTVASFYNVTVASTQAATFTLPALVHYEAEQGTFGAGSTVSSQVGFRVHTSVIGATSNIAFQGQIPSASNNWNLYMDGTANNYLAGGLGIGTVTIGNFNGNIAIGKTITGNTNSRGIYLNSTVQSDVTSSAIGYLSTLSLQAATFTLNELTHFKVTQGTYGSGSAINDQFAFYVDSSFTGATYKNIAYYGAIASASGQKYNIYMAGTAPNYLAGALSIGVTTANASALLQVDSTTQGVLFPRMTTTQKNAISSPAVGLIVYDTTLNKLCVYTGAWQTITSA